MKIEGSKLDLCVGIEKVIVKYWWKERVKKWNNCRGLMVDISLLQANTLELDERKWLIGIKLKWVSIWMIGPN